MRVGQGSRKLEGWWLKVRQFHGLLVKRFHCARRNSKALSSQILLPAFFVCVAMTVALSVPEIGMAARPGIRTSALLGSRVGNPHLLWAWALRLRLVGMLLGSSGIPAFLGSRPQAWALWVLGRGDLGLGDAGRPQEPAQASPCTPPGDLPPLVLSPSQYHNYTQPRGNFIPYANEERREYR